MSTETMDALDRRIAERLGTRSNISRRLAELGQPAKKTYFPKTIIWSAVAAAVIVFALVVVPLWNRPANPWDEANLSAPEFESYRAASPEMEEISRLIKEKDFDEALTKVRTALHHSDTELEYLEMGIIVSGDDELIYEADMEGIHNEELRWTYIYLLTLREQYDEAYEELNRYLRKNKDGNHYAEAKALKKEIKKIRKKSSR